MSYRNYITSQSQSEWSLRARFMEVMSALFQTVLEIIEDKPTFVIPNQVYAILMTLNIFQISGYIFCTGYPKPYLDEKWTTISHVNEYSTGTFLLLVRSIDTVTLIFFMLIEIVIYSYFAYVFLLCYIKNRAEAIYFLYKKTFSKINQALVLFFTVYYWIFLTPFTEVSLGILSCNEFAFLFEYRNQDNCDTKPFIWRIIGFIGVLLSIITNLMILFFFRNYEFFESNLLKRKFSYYQIVICISYLGLQFAYYIKDFFPAFKYIIAQIMGISMVLDIILNYPFRDTTIQYFYILGTAYFWVSHSIMTFWIYTDGYDSNQLFFTFMIFCTFLAFLLAIIQQNQYENLLKLRPANFNQHYERIDFYTEQMLRFSRDSNKDETYKFKIFEMVVYHKENCVNTQCVCKSESFRDDKSQISQSFILKLIECIFRDSMKKKAIKDNMVELEHLQLKFITFLAKFANNPVEAYYELKLFHFTQKRRISSYFSVISQVLSISLQEHITAHQNSKFFASSMSAKPKPSISLHAIIQTDQIKQKAIPLLASQVNERIKFWNRLKLGFASMDNFAEVASDFYHKSKMLKQTFGEIINGPNFQEIFKNNAVLIKIIALFNCLVQSEILKSFELEQQVNELKKRDDQKTYLQIHTLNLMQGNVQVFQASLSQDRGRITNTLTENHARFFNQHLSEMKAIKNIKDMMPRYIARAHDSLIENYIERGHSMLLQQGFLSFALDRSGFIFPVQVNLSPIFNKIDDFCVNSVLLKLVSEKEFLVMTSKGANLGMSRQLFSSLFFHHNSEVFGQKSEDEIQELKKDFQKINVFLFMPKLIKIMQSYKTAGTNQKNSMSSMRSTKGIVKHGEDGVNMNQTTQSLSRKSQQLQVIKQDKALIQIPYNIFDLHIAFLKHLGKDHNSNLHNAILSKSPDAALDDLDVLELYEDFISLNIEDWERENCVSTLDVVVNVSVEYLDYRPNDRKRGQGGVKNVIEDVIETQEIFRIEFTEILERDMVESSEEKEEGSINNNNTPMSPYGTSRENKSNAFQNQFQTISLDNSQVYKASLSSNFPHKVTKKTKFANSNNNHVKEDYSNLDSLTHYDASGANQNLKENPIDYSAATEYSVNLRLDQQTNRQQNLHSFQQQPQYHPETSTQRHNQQGAVMESDRSFLMQSSLTSPVAKDQSQLNFRNDNESILNCISPKMTAISIDDQALSSVTGRQLFGCHSDDERGLISQQRSRQSSIHQQHHLQQQQKQQQQQQHLQYQPPPISITISNDNSESMLHQSLRLGNNQQQSQSHAQHHNQQETLFTVGQVLSPNFADNSMRTPISKLFNEINQYEEEKDLSNLNNKTNDNLRRRRVSTQLGRNQINQIIAGTNGIYGASNNVSAGDSSSLMLMLNHNNNLNHLNNNNIPQTTNRTNLNNESRLTDIGESQLGNSAHPNDSLAQNMKKQTSTLTAKLKSYLFMKRKLFKEEYMQKKQQAANAAAAAATIATRRNLNFEFPNAHNASFSQDQPEYFVSPPASIHSEINFQQQKHHHHTQQGDEDQINLSPKNENNKSSRKTMGTPRNLKKSARQQQQQEVQFEKTTIGNLHKKQQAQQQQQMPPDRQSVSSINQAIRSIDNSLIQQIAHQRRINSSYVINILLYVLSAAFCVSSLIYIGVFYQFRADLAISIDNSDRFKDLNLLFTNQTLASLYIFEVSSNILSSDQLDWVSSEGFCQSISSRYHDSLASNFQFIDQMSSAFDDNTYSIHIYSNQERFENEVNLLEVYLQTSFAISKVCENHQGRDGLLYLLSNLQSLLKTSESLMQNEIDQMSLKLGGLGDFYFLYAIIVIAIFSSTTFLSIPILKRINEYKEKVLLLVSRLNFHECDHEIRKLQTCLTSLSSTQEAWLFDDFVQIVTSKEQNFYDPSNEFGGNNEKSSNKKSTRKQQESSMSNTRKNKNNNNNNNSNNNNANKKNKSQQFSSLILNQKLSIWKHTLIVFLLSLSGVTFFGVAIYLSSQKDKQLLPSVNIYEKSLVNLSALQTLIVGGEILVRSPRLENSLPSGFTLFENLDSLKEVYFSRLNSLVAFTADFSGEIQGEIAFSTDEENQLKSIFINDLCLKYTDDYVCTSRDSLNSLRGVLSAGLMSVLTTYKSLTISFSDLYNLNVKSDAYEETITRFTETSEFEYVLLKGFATPARALNQITESLGEFVHNGADSLFQFVLLYFLVGGTLVGLTWFLFCMKIRKKINDDLAGISFSLTCIPFEKSNEDATIFMLKAIKKM